MVLQGSFSKHEFQAETKKLLDIVARSLYSEKEVCAFVFAYLASYLHLCTIHCSMWRSWHYYCPLHVFFFFFTQAHHKLHVIVVSLQRLSVTRGVVFFLT